MTNTRDPRIFTDRVEAGRLLAALLRPVIDPGQMPVVLGLARGGVPVAFEVADRLAAPLDVIVVAKLGIPWQPESAMGAVAEGGARIIDAQIVEAATVSPHEVDLVVRHEQARVAERVARLHPDRPPRLLGGQTVIIVDDGLSTGASMRVACQVARTRGAGRIVVAVPVASAAGLRAVDGVADQVVVLRTPDGFVGVGQWYLDFSQIDDEDVAELLVAAETGVTTESRPVDPSDPSPSPVRVEDLVLPVGEVTLPGRLTVPSGARELVIIAHDSSRERCSARSRYLSRNLSHTGFATLLVDLLTGEEAAHGNHFLALPLLASRLRAVTRTVGADYERVDYLAAGVAAAIALEAASTDDPGIHALVCLGGRPDLVAHLGAVRAPTLFVVGDEDSVVLRLTQQALERVRCAYRLVTIPASGHRFREPGALRLAAAHARAWLLAPGDPAGHPADGAQHGPAAHSAEKKPGVGPKVPPDPVVRP